MNVRLQPGLRDRCDLIRRVALGLAVVAALLPTPSRGADPPSASLASIAPADVCLFVEARDAPDLLIPLAEPQLWGALAELVGQPADPARVEQWRRQIRDAVKMEPQNAIRVLFSERVAYMSPALWASNDALIACRLMPEIKPDDLLRIWKARVDPEFPGGNVYRLGAGLGLVVREHVLQFGDPGAPDGLLRRAMNSAPPPRTLAADPLYRDLLAGAPSDPDAVFFARVNGHGRAGSASAPDSQPGATSAPAESDQLLRHWPGPLRGASAVLLAMTRNGALLRFSVVTDAPPPIAANPGPPLLESLPAGTLLAWEMPLSPQELKSAIDALPERHALRVALHAEAQRESWARLLGALRPPVALAIGAGPAEGDAPQPPVVAMMLTLADGGAAQEAWSALVGASSAAASMLAVASGRAPIAAPESLDLAGVAGTAVELTPLLPPRFASALGRLELCWARDDDVLIIASHRMWLREIIAARRGMRPRLASTPVLAAGRLAPASAATQAAPPMPAGGTRIVAQIGALSDLGATWLTYLERTAPQVLSERWWRQRQPRNVRLGIDVTEDGATSRLRVVGVTPDTPAFGRLLLDDWIVGANSRRFATSQPLAEMRTALEERSSPRRIDLLVERGGAERALQVPLPFVDLVSSLRQLVAVGRVAQFISYVDQPPARLGRAGQLTIELRPERTASQPASRPGSAPSSRPSANPSRPG